MKSIIVTLLMNSLLSTIVIDQPWTGGPGSSGTWTAGQSATIVWHTEGSNNPQTMNLDIVSGPTNNLQSVASIGTNVDVSGGKLTIIAPSNLKSSNSYAIRATSGSISVYSSVFTFVNDSPTASTASKPLTNGSNLKTFSGLFISLLAILFLAMFAC